MARLILSTMIVIASRNQGKVKEIEEMLKGFNVQIKCVSDFGPIPEIVEDEETFDGNAYKKASMTARFLGLPAMADDSGLEVEALNGRPGVMSARYAGEGATDADNVTKLLTEMRGVENRKARFTCVVSIAVPTGPALTYEGKCDGLITEKSAGTGGFGYDPVFFSPAYGKTFAALSMAEKNRISHRGKVFKEVVGEFDKILKWIEMHMPAPECLSGGCH